MTKRAVHTAVTTAVQPEIARRLKGDCGLVRSVTSSQTNYLFILTHLFFFVLFLLGQIVLGLQMSFYRLEDYRRHAAQGRLQ